MWTLFVISMVYVADEQMDVKVTRYKEYDSEWNCNVALDNLEKEFVMGETAMCYQTGNPIPRVDTLY